MNNLLREVTPSLAWTKQSGKWRTELFAGLVGAIVVIPQGITFAYLAGLPPEYGLYCAIFVTFVTSLFGSSSMISGPNTAVSILIGVAVLPLAGRGSPVYIDFVMLLSMMVGIIQLLFWLFRGAIIFQFISPAAIAGISAGAGFLIVMASLDSILGIADFRTSFFFEKLYVIFSSGSDTINPYALAIGLTTILCGYAGKRYSSRYYIIMAVAGGYCCGLVIGFIWPQPMTELDYLGHMPLSWLPLQLPTINQQYLMSSISLFPYAFAIAFIGLAQSLVIANGLKTAAEQDISLDKEVFAQGFANFLAPFFSAFAGSGSFNRTRVNQSLNASSPLSGISSSFFVLLIISLSGAVLAYMPMAVMSGTLFIVGIDMLKWQEAKHFFKVKTELIIYVTTLLTVILLGLAEGVVVAVLFSVSLFLLNIISLDISEKKTAQGVIVKVRGALFYASVGQLAAVFKRHTDDNVILDLAHTSYIDQAAVDLFVRESVNISKQQNQLILILADKNHQLFVRRLERGHKILIVDQLQDINSLSGLTVVDS